MNEKIFFLAEEMFQMMSDYKIEVAEIKNDSKFTSAEKRQILLKLIDRADLEFQSFCSLIRK